jgi:hypothetical protein
MQMADYSWVTSEMFESGLHRVLEGMTPDRLLAIPGAYELLSEYYNNEVLELLEAEKQMAEEDL